MMILKIIMILRLWPINTRP